MSLTRTAIEQTGPVLYRVEVNDHIWKGHVKQVQNSYPCSPVMEVTDDCAVPEQKALDACCCMPAVVQMEWNDGPPKDVTFEGDLLSPGPESQELSPQPE